MKMKTVVNTLIVSSIILTLYFFVGHGFVKFYFSGKKEILQTAAFINDLCNASGSCPLTGCWKTIAEPIVVGMV